jgi:hypothetical protein
MPDQTPTAEQAPAGLNDLLTLTETAELLRTPVATLRYWRHLGIGPVGFRLGRRVVYRRADVSAWIDDQRVGRVEHR